MITCRGQMLDAIKNDSDMVKGIVFWKSPITNGLEFEYIYSNNSVTVKNWLGWIYSHKVDLFWFDVGTYISISTGYDPYKCSKGWSDVVMNMEA